MKQVCWHSSRSKAYRGLPEARGQSEAHGDSTLYTMGVRPCVTAKLPVLGPWFWNLILLNLAAASCYLHGGRFWRQQVPSPLWWRNLLQVLVRELNHFKQQRKALRQASQLCCFGVQMQFVKKRRAQICGQIQRFIKISTELRRQTRTSTTHTKHKRSACSRKPN